MRRDHIAQLGENLLQTLRQRIFRVQLNGAAADVTQITSVILFDDAIARVLAAAIDAQHPHASGVYRRSVVKRCECARRGRNFCATTPSESRIAVVEVRYEAS